MDKKITFTTERIAELRKKCLQEGGRPVSPLIWNLVANYEDAPSERDTVRNALRTILKFSDEDAATFFDKLRSTENVVLFTGMYEYAELKEFQFDQLSLSRNEDNPHAPLILSVQPA